MTTTKTEKTGPESVLDKEKLDKAIRENFRDTPGQISIRHLWTVVDVHRYRVNWWESGQLATSLFLHVYKDKKKIIVRTQDGQ